MFILHVLTVGLIATTLICGYVNSAATPIKTSKATTCQTGDITIDTLNCQRYYFCQDNEWTGPYECPDDLYWNNKIQGCVDILQSDCELSTVPEKITTPKPTSRAPSSHQPWVCESGTLTGDTLDSRRYYLCVDNDWKGPYNCPNSLYWNENLNGCVDNKSTTRATLTSTTKIPNSKPTEDPNKVTSKKPWVCVNGDLVGDSLDCQRYYVCHENNWEGPYECPNMLFWSSHLKGCVYITDTYDCVNPTTTKKVTSTTPTPYLTTTAPDSSSQKPWVCRSGELTGDSLDCERYYKCKNNNWEGPFKCPSMLYWSESLKGCITNKDNKCT